MLKYAVIGIVGYMLYKKLYAKPALPAAAATPIAGW